ncbi:DUF4249 domain-containing protein [Fulvivirga lutea]|uniref:DUF4249 domain-containing protein n=1 Tax=Fulvivirga lutea TaxID=2810512 RepID=A0A974WHN0_9BACT|nr:DUF4249 domain-containing protein [Fulvivirga lutea]QSE97898.1 DUF4249 domain-containing protein [Fulvivirga lutea]
MKSLVNISLCFVILCGCIDPINFEIDSNNDGNIVIDALITDREGTSRVIVSKSIAYSDNSSNPSINKVRNAQVILNAGADQIIFSENGLGTYIPPSDFKAIEGIDYKLVIELSEGEKLESTVQRLVKNAGIDIVNKEYNFRSTLSKNNVEVSKGGVELFLDTDILEEDNKYYRWQFTGTYQIETKPYLSVVPPPPPCGTAPPPDCTCCICWVIEHENLIISDPNFISGKIKNVPIAFIENSEGRFQEKYHFNIDQFSITQEEHEFWKRIKNQKEQNSIFAQQVGEIPSNIHTVDKENSAVRGYFSVSSIVSASGYLTREDVPERVSVLPELIGTCLGFEGATNIKPPYWE